LSCKESAPQVPTLVDGELNWISLEEAQAINNSEGRMFLVDVYTEWCGWCKVMDKKTFTDEEVKAYLGKNFYVIKFDAEQKEKIVFKGKEYEWTPSGRKGVNMLAVELLNGRLGYPSLVFLDENLNKIEVIPGYKTPEQLMPILKKMKSVL
jgi:thioredoxin-related protein